MSAQRPAARRLCAALALLLSACGGAAPEPDEAAPQAGAEGPGASESALPDGNARLPAGTTPLRARLDLRIDPAADSTRGSVETDLLLDAPRPELRLHAEGLQITRATAAAVDGLHLGQAAYGPHGGLAIRFDQPLPAGELTLRLDFQTPLAEIPDGLYRVRLGAAAYAFSQFEPLAARKAFPCFDEPGFKLPWEVTVRVPPGQVAVSNMPEAGRRTEGGLDVVKFTTSPPLPTYLLAFAVGPLDVVEAPAGAASVPLRIFATAGRAREAALALAQAPRILQALEAWFGRPVPYPKLDLVAVPNFAAGAMENPGLVTFRERLLLLDERAPTGARQGLVGVMAHEFAHLWFGDLVTMAWWDDLWLNEAFASFLGNQIVQTVEPAFESETEQAAGAGGPMSLDAQASARAVRQPIRDGGDVENAFDGITYGKGALVLSMLEAYLGPPVFQRGVRDYLAAHAHGSARTADLADALGRAAGHDVSGIVEDFTTRPGTPLLQLSVRCAGAGPAHLTIGQSRFRPLDADTPETGPWRVPVCLRYAPADGQAPRTQCLLLESPQTELDLDAPGCPRWLHPNADERGYYRWSLDPAARDALLGQLDTGALTPRERMALPGHLSAWLEAGLLDIGAAADWALRLAASDHWLLVGGGTGLLRGIFRLLGERPDPALTALLARALRPHLDRLGLAPRPGEPVADRNLRNAAVSALADMAEPPELLAEAARIAAAFLRDPAAVDPEQAGLYLPLAATRGDLTLWLGLAALLSPEGTAGRALPPVTRDQVIRALGSFREPKLLTRSLEAALVEPLRAQDLGGLLGAAGARDETRRLAWRFVTSHWDALAARQGEKGVAGLPWVAARACSAEARSEALDFFRPGPHAVPGTERNLRLTVESIDRCLRFQARHEGGARQWLRTRTSGPP